MLRGAELDLERIKRALDPLGESLVVAGDRSLARVHIHAPDPASVFAAAGALGTVEGQRVQDLDRGRRGEAGNGYTLLAGAEGRGFLRLFESLGAVPVGRHGWMAVLRRLARRGAGPIPILLPNSEEDTGLVDRLRRGHEGLAVVVATKTIPQGIAAALAFDPQLALEANLARMRRAAAQVRTIEIRRNGANGRFLARLDGKRAAEGPDLQQVLQRSLEKLSAREADVATVYYRRLPLAEAAASLLRGIYPKIRVESYAGGQPGCELVISIE
jgi:dihydroxyacetone kinase-like predicted kinase